MKDMELVTLGFKKSYDVVNESYNNEGPEYVFSYNRQEKSRIALTGFSCKVTTTDRRKWLGLFECGRDGVSSIFFTPSDTTVCVVCGGIGYWIPVNCPWEYSIIKILPIKEIFVIPDQPYMVFMDYTQLALYGTQGCVWITPEISYDGIEITNLTASIIKGTTWSSSENRKVPFEINLINRKLAGGPFSVSDYLLKSPELC